VYAIADTGVDFNHPNINKNYIGRKEDGSYDHNKAWWDGVRRLIASEGTAKCGFASNAPCDDQGHGTHVTSIAVGADGYGVAPGARWMACRNMDRGLGSPETYLSCLNFFLAPHDLDGKNADPKRRPHVVGNSYGCPDSEGCSKGAMTAAVEALRAAGVFMSVSAGNEGPNCSTIADPPALEKAVISVGATDNDDNLASFSSRGPCIVGKGAYRKPDLSAPGVRVTAAYPGGGFRALSGTSMASPHVGGAVALISAMCPHLVGNVDKLQSLLERTAVKLLPPSSAQPLCGGDLPTSVPNNYFGHGRIDVLAAVRECRKIEL
jgi:subtilisin family serine protease